MVRTIPRVLIRFEPTEQITNLDQNKKTLTFERLYLCNIQSGTPAGTFCETVLGWNREVWPTVAGT